MSFQPQNPFEFVEQMLLNASQAVSQGLGRGIQATEQRAAQEAEVARREAEAARQQEVDRGKVAQQYGLQLLPTLQNLASQIGDEDPELVAALGAVAREVERGVLSDPSRAAQLIGDARAKLTRRQQTTESIEFPASFLGEPGAMSDDMRTMSVTSETVTEHEYTPQQLITYSLARAGDIERLRAMTNAERENAINMEFEQFKSNLIAARETASSNYQFGQTLVRSASESLATLQTVINLLPEDQREGLQPQIVALQALATSTPQAAYSIYEQTMSEGQDVFLALAEVSGLTQTLTGRQERILARWDNFVSRIQDNDDVDRAAARRALEETEQLLPEYVIDGLELEMVRQFLGLPNTLYSAEDYVGSPEKMGAGLMPYAVRDQNGFFKLNEEELEARNPELYRAYTEDVGNATEALTRLYNLRATDNLDYATGVSDAAREVIETSIGYDQLPAEARVEVRRALGNATGGDAWARRELASRAALASQAAEATYRITVAEGEIAVLELPAKLTDWARAGDYGALVAYQQQDPSRANDDDLNSLIAQAREVHLAQLDIVRYDRQTREYNAQEAMRKAVLGEYLNEYERAALQASYEFDKAKFQRDLAQLPLETTGDVAQILSTVAEVVPEEWWDSANLPAHIKAAVDSTGLMPALKAISRSSQYELGSDVRDDVRTMILNAAEAIPDAPEGLLMAINDAMDEAGFSPAMAYGFNQFIQNSWRMLEESERRANAADQRAETALEYDRDRVITGQGQLDLGWANHWLRANELAKNQDVEGARELIGLVDSLVDNQRQGLAARHDQLVRQGCAAPGSTVFGGATELQPDQPINAGVHEGQPCSILTEPFLADYEGFLATEQWHTDLVKGAGELLGGPVFPEQEAAFEGTDTLQPYALGNLTRERDWPTVYSDFELNKMAPGEVIAMVAGLANTIEAGDYGRYNEENVRGLYIRAMRSLAGRFGPEEAERLRDEVQSNPARGR